MNKEAPIRPEEERSSVATKYHVLIVSASTFGKLGEHSKRD